MLISTAALAAESQTENPDLWAAIEADTRRAEAREDAEKTARHGLWRRPFRLLAMAGQ